MEGVIDTNHPNKKNLQTTVTLNTANRCNDVMRKLWVSVRLIVSVKSIRYGWYFGKSGMFGKTGIFGKGFGVGGNFGRSGIFGKTDIYGRKIFGMGGVFGRNGIFV